MATEFETFKHLTLELIGILIQLSKLSFNISSGIPVDSLPKIKYILSKVFEKSNSV